MKWDLLNPSRIKTRPLTVVDRIQNKPSDLRQCNPYMLSPSPSVNPLLRHQVYSLLPPNLVLPRSPPSFFTYTLHKIHFLPVLNRSLKPHSTLSWFNDRLTSMTPSSTPSDVLLTPTVLVIFFFLSLKSNLEVFLNNSSTNLYSHHVSFLTPTSIYNSV